jgi:MFS family permease
MRALPALLKRHPALRWYALGNFQSAIGTGAATVGLVLIAYERAHTAWAVAAVLSANMLPIVLLGVPLGAVADRYGYRPLAVAGDLLRAGAFVGIGLAHPLWLTIVFVLVYGLGAACFSPAANAAVPLLAGPEDAAAATSAVQIVDTIGQALGPLICAPLLLVVSPNTIMLFNGITFLVNALILRRVPLRAQAHSRREHQRAWPTLVADARAGLRTVLRERVLWSLMALMVLLVFIAALQNVGQPVLVLGPLHASASAYSVMIMVNNIGFALGTVFCPRDGPLRTLLLRFLAGMLVMAVAALGYALADSIWTIAIPFLLAGIGNTIILVVIYTIYVKVTPGEFLGRIIGVHITAGNASMVLSFLLSGPLIATLGVRGAFRLEAVGVTAVLILGAILLRPLIAAPRAIAAEVTVPPAAEER